jgi:Rieske Fe-S protein
VTHSPQDRERTYPDGRPLAEQPSWQRDFPTDEPADQGLARREFAKFLALTSGAFASGQCWIAGMSVLRGDRPYPELRIAEERELTPGQVVEFRYPNDDEPCLLIRLGDGRLVAYGQKCSHLACAVIPEPAARRLACPCHKGYFELEAGRPIAGPPRRPLPRVRLVVREGVIYAVGVEHRTS